MVPPMSAAPPPSPSAASFPPSAFGQYRLVRQLGRGGMGEVYLAHDVLLDRQVAIKFLRALQPDPNLREQFLIEARAAARVEHANVLNIYGIGEINEQLYIVSEFVPGQDLAALRKPLSWQRVLGLGIGIAHGLAAAHHQGVVHRELFAPSRCRSTCFQRAEPPAQERGKPPHLIFFSKTDRPRCAQSLRVLPVATQLLRARRR